MNGQNCEAIACPEVKRGSVAMRAFLLGFVELGIRSNISAPKAASSLPWLDEVAANNLLSAKRSTNL